MAHLGASKVGGWVGGGASRLQLYHSKGVLLGMYQIILPPHDLLMQLSQGGRHNLESPSVSGPNNCRTEGILARSCVSMPFD